MRGDVGRFGCGIIVVSCGFRVDMWLLFVGVLGGLVELCAVCGLVCGVDSWDLGYLGHMCVYGMLWSGRG